MDWKVQLSELNYDECERLGQLSSLQRQVPHEKRFCRGIEPKQVGIKYLRRPARVGGSKRPTPRAAHEASEIRSTSL